MKLSRRGTRNARRTTCPVGPPPNRHEAWAYWRCSTGAGGREATRVACSATRCPGVEDMLRDAAESILAFTSLPEPLSHRIAFRLAVSPPAQTLAPARTNLVGMNTTIRLRCITIGPTGSSLLEAEPRAVRAQAFTTVPIFRRRAHLRVGAAACRHQGGRHDH
jgi:hypothetical protein